MAGYGEERDVITAPLLADVIRELEENGQLGSRTPGRRPWARPGVQQGVQQWPKPQAAHQAAQPR